MKTDIARIPCRDRCDYEAWDDFAKAMLRCDARREGHAILRIAGEDSDHEFSHTHTPECDVRWWQDMA